MSKPLLFLVFAPYTSPAPRNLSLSLSVSPPDLFAWDAAGVPAALTDEMERQQREKEKEKKKRSKAKKKETEEKDR